jgi:hypothetical protein
MNEWDLPKVCKFNSMFKTQVTATELKEKLYNSISADTEKAFFMILNALLIKSVSKV